MLQAGFYNLDCTLGMAQFPDKFFSLAIVDPPYGIQYARGKNGWGEYDRRADRKDVKWDSCVPDSQYFTELARVSQNQIVWGGNYFTDKLPVSKCWITWDKCNGTVNKSVFSDLELAWTSFTKVCRMYRLRQMGFISDTNDNDRIHPTQKPTELYRWLLSNYAKPGDKILDTHVGSASSLIACHQMGFEYWGFELDTDYYNAATDRLNKVKAQVTLDELIQPEHEQISL